jgi:hypothetical protein
MTPVTAPVPTSQTAPTGGAAVGSEERANGSGPVAPKEPVSLRTGHPAATPTDLGSNAIPSQITIDSPTSADTSIPNWPNLQTSKPNPGSDDWRALERRAFSLRLRGPLGEIDGEICGEI